MSLNTAEILCAYEHVNITHQCIMSSDEPFNPQTSGGYIIGHFAMSILT